MEAAFTTPPASWADFQKLLGSYSELELQIREVAEMAKNKDDEP